MTDTILLVAGLLAEEAPRDTGPDFGKAAPFGLLIVVLLLIGTFLLVRSMNRHLKRLPESFEGGEDTGHSTEDGAAGQDPERKAQGQDPERKAEE